MADEHDQFRPTRRIVFNGLGALGVAVALAGCGSSSDSGSGSSSSPSAKAGKVLAKTTDVPVGGGLILTDQKVVITQETAGSFKAFSAVCTHQGFIVTSVDGNLIHCSHHGSEYNAKTGAVVHGPAPKALASVAITVKGGKVLAA